MKPVYLGDGLYAIFDGYQIVLMANSPRVPTDMVALNSETYAALVEFVERLKSNEYDEERQV